MNTCGMCETPVEHGYLCPGCTRALADRLQRMPRLYNALGAFLAPAATREPGGGRTGRAEAPCPSASPSSTSAPTAAWSRPWRPGAATCTLLAAGRRPPRLWASRTAWRSQRARSSTPSTGSPPAGPRPATSPTKSVTSNATSPPSPAPANAPCGLRLGPCPAEHTDGTLCGAILRLQPGEQLVTCRWCATTYPPGTWALLKQLIDHDAQQAAA